MITLSTLLVLSGITVYFLFVQRKYVLYYLGVLAFLGIAWLPGAITGVPTIIYLFGKSHIFAIVYLLVIALIVVSYLAGRKNETSQSLKKLRVGTAYGFLACLVVHLIVVFLMK